MVPKVDKKVPRRSARGHTLPSQSSGLRPDRPQAPVTSPQT